MAEAMAVTDVQRRLQSLWPASNRISLALCAEIVAGLDSRGLGPDRFEQALRAYREHDERYPPTWNGLRPFLPRQQQSHVLWGIPDHADEYQQAVRLYRACRYVELCDLAETYAHGTPEGYTAGQWREHVERMVQDQDEREARARQQRHLAAESKLRLNVAYERMVARARRREEV